MAGDFWDMIRAVFVSPGVGNGAAGTFAIGQFYRWTGLFWRAIEAEDLIAAQNAFLGACEYVAQTGGMMRVAATIARMETALVNLEQALALAAEEGAAGELFTGLGPGGVLACLVIFGLYALRHTDWSFSQPAMAATLSSGQVFARPHPVYTAEQMRRLQETSWRTLIVGPPPAVKASKTNRFAARAIRAALPQIRSKGIFR